MNYNVSQIDPMYNFTISGASYAGKPRSGTAMYITKKVEKLLDNLKGVSNCLVFIENGIKPQEDLIKENCFIQCDNPQMAYANFIKVFDQFRIQEDLSKKYTLVDGFYVGEDVTIGENAYIEPGCLIGHGVSIGKNCRIMAGAVIKNAIIGDNFICGENAVVGANGFTMAEDELGNKFRMPTLGKVIIGNDVEIGHLTSICIGQGGDTVIHDYVKIDALVHVGHDCNLGNNTEIPAGVIVGGYVRTGEKAYMGINSVIRNRVDIGEKSTVGMGAVVTKNVPDNETVVGNPARRFK